MQGTDTIAAMATGSGEAGIAIVRVSGPDATEIAKSVLRFKEGAALTPSRFMRLAFLISRAGSEERILDQVLAVYFRSPFSYTGEDVVEIQTSGGRLAARLCLDLLIKEGARLALPGEFTKRAFLNGRIDLSQAEAVLGVIEARSEEALKAAARTLSGELSSLAASIRDHLLDIQGDIEIGLDFPEGETPYIEKDAIAASLSAIKIELSDLLERSSVGAALRDGLSVSLNGSPNVGKSSLLNALLKRPRAIVSSSPGTTRDTVEESVTFGGVPVRLSDTAGIRDAADDIETLGIERAFHAMNEADIVVWVIDGSAPLTEDEKNHISRLENKEHIIVLNKSDCPKITKEADIQAVFPKSALLSVSAKTGEGLDWLKKKITDICLQNGSLDAGLNVTSRQLNEMRISLESVETAIGALSDGNGEDVLATLIASAREALERLLGLDCDEALLDSVFSKFCVGK
ncbi:tRNA modification GTPase MnmE [Synergistales bacterium]|nr:tRNA modification GTPase MnmE [Synergistales bacterium]